MAKNLFIASVSFVRKKVFELGVVVVVVVAVVVGVVVVVVVVATPNRAMPDLNFPHGKFFPNQTFLSRFSFVVGNSRRWFRSSEIQKILRVVPF